MRRFFSLLSVIVFTLGINTALVAQPGGGGNGGPGGGGPGMHQPDHPPFWNQLTPEQRATLQELIQSLQDSGATPQEIHDAVQAQLEAWGITPPAGGGGNGGPNHPPFWNQLTPEQQTALQELIQSLQDSGATPQEIHDAVLAQLLEWGITPPEGGGGNGGPHPPFWSQLTPEQQTALQELIQSLHDSGATPQEIHEAVLAQLLEWGITPPEGGGGNGGPHHPPFWDQLTAEQQAILQALIQSMRDEGATMEEIRAAIHAQLTEWGIELPPPPPAPGAGNHPPYWDQLTLEQRHEIQLLIRDMRHAGATAEEIHTAIDALLLEWGFSMPVQEALADDPSEDNAPEVSNIPQKFEAYNYPNPFNPTTTISYTLDSDGPVSVTIYDIQGREVRNLVQSGNKAAGTYRVVWDALDNYGSTVVSGVYLMRVNANGQLITKRLVYMK